jgi:RNA polymerase-binding transcription factor DksA
MAKSKPQKKDAISKNGSPDSAELVTEQSPPPADEDGDETLPPFLRKQKSKLLQLRDTLLDSMMGVSRDTLRSRAEGSEASAFGMHQADAGSDAYDRDFALSLLSQEQDALYEIEEALKRVDAGTYGICEMSGKPIPHARLEAIPFARFTVECQTQIEKQKKALRVRQPVTSLFGLTDEEGGEGEEEDTITDSKD